MADNKNLRKEIASYYKEKGIKVYHEKEFTFIPLAFDIILSAHVDTVKKPIMVCINDLILGLLDNRLGVEAVWKNVENVGKVFTEGEEEGGTGAQAFSKFLVENKITPDFIIAIDVTHYGGDEIYISLENLHLKRFNEIIKIIRKDKEIRIIEKGEFDEANVYGKYFDSFSACIPIKGEDLHEGCRIERERFNKYLEKLKEIISLLRKLK